MERGGDKAWSLLLAIGVHLIAAALMLLGLQFNKPVELGGAAPLQAVMVDLSNLQNLPRPPPAQPRVEPPQPAPRPEPAPPPPPAQTAPAEPSPQIIEDQAAQLRQSQLAAEQAAAAERLRIQQERERIEQEKQRELDRQRELEEIRKEREQAEARRKEEARKLEAVRQQQARDAAERQAAEAAAQAAAQAAAANREADSLLQQYASLIQAVVTENWRRPLNTPPGIRCTLNVRQIPGGEVIGVTIGRPCNATGAVQQSILEAVERASPLPYSGFERVFSRDLSFNFYYNG
jgi:colicin import membrane protein